MRKICVAVTIILIMLCITIFMITNNEKKVELVQAPVSTMEPYELYGKWEQKIFEPYGFGEVVLPAEAYHDRCESGEYYAIGTFYTDSITSFQYFFQLIYRVIWGEIYDVTKVMENNNGVYTFQEKCVIPKADIVAKQQETQDGTEEGAYTNFETEYMSVYVEFNTNNNKVTFECRKVDKSGKSLSSNDSKSKKTDKKEK